ncbi:type II toxin-antitoxin system MqsR family toxin [Scandinavium goeteborgense]|uniref:type II toxin-antitoxin system MqsR family toxin n=1 Tax=Scandinavium goeteborgense TaxID=1851514 RepID=UPI0038043D1C
MMEKGTPHTRLHIIQQKVREGKVRATASAYEGAEELGFSQPLLPWLCDIILMLRPCDFYKSMTALHDHTLWHEVYRPICGRQKIYMKLIVQEGVLIVSFKEL